MTKNLYFIAGIEKQDGARLFRLRPEKFYRTHSCKCRPKEFMLATATCSMTKLRAVAKSLPTETLLAPPLSFGPANSIDCFAPIPTAVIAAKAIEAGLWPGFGWQRARTARQFARATLGAGPRLMLPATTMKEV